MADSTEPQGDASPRDWRDTVFLPRTDFPMKAGLPQKEPAILARWQGEDLYGQVRAARAGREKFILHDGPPYANGDMHIGHALNHILKDMVVRTQTLLGRDAPYVPGWDCHGLPIEWKVEEQYRKKKQNKDEVPPAEFRAECRAYAQHWVDTQREQLKRLGINGDWDHPYLTMDTGAEAIIVSELLKFAETGQLYRGAKPVMWSPVEKTALAEAEVEYEDITSTQIDVAFEIVDSPIAELVGAHAVIWTTTPWTIPVNQALAYGPEVEYQLLETFVDGGQAGDTIAFLDSVSWTTNERVKLRFLIAVELAESFGKRIEAALPLVPEGHGDRTFWCYPVGDTIKGSDLAGTIVRHPMHHLGGFFARPRPMLPGDFVTTDAGTGLVHMAPDHGEDDFELCKANGIDPVFAVEGDGRYRADWAWLGGQGSVINPKFTAPDGPICSDLREAGALLAAAQDYRHSYPHSWRSKAKLIFRATPQWFIAMDRSLSRHLPGAGDGAEVGAPSEPPAAASPNSSPPVGEEGARDASASWEGEGVDAAGDTFSPRSGALPNPAPEMGEGLTLRETAMRAIAETRWIPEKGRNRIAAMVAGRPDWVISRQRAWGVPITLFVHRRTGQYLDDPAVNARIVAAFEEHGVEAWTEAAVPGFLGDAHDPADYERVTDILDVWFDSGSTHAFVLESGRWPDLRWPADLYLEGSDQHRGWFQSSLLESCGTRGRAPYDAVLTHGFTMDAKGLKMSKSLGNTVDPLVLMKETGADILRLWALSIDFTEDHRIGKEILAGVSDGYRKLRNTFRYLLGALDGFDEDERVAVEDMPDLERYMLHLGVVLDAELREAVAAYDFSRYVRVLGDFCNNDLSAFFFDVRKDSLYCDAAGDPKRMAYRTVLDVMFHALVRWLAPVLCFTAEEAWGTRFPDRGSVHLLEWPAIDPDWREPKLAEQWERLRAIRLVVNAEIEPKRRAKEIGSSLEARVVVGLPDERDRPNVTGAELAEILIVSDAVIEHSAHGPIAVVHRTDHHKCGRCWRHLPEVPADAALCGRCATVVK